MNKFKEGAASFYIVAISTLILVIIAASFAAIIISELTRTSNDDLAQSAYDSALAGIEDAKLAYYNYRKCQSDSSFVSGSMSCDDVKDLVENSKSSEESCSVVAKILGRSQELDGSVLISESGQNDMQQYYTCVKITDQITDTKVVLTESNPEYETSVKFDSEEIANKIEKIRVTWKAAEADEAFAYANYSSNGLFNVNPKPLPAVISVGIVQTGDSFRLSSFDATDNGQTNRGTIYLVPRKSDTDTSSGANKKFYIAGENNAISKQALLKSNDKTTKNLPYSVLCNNDDECSATIELPKPIGGYRSDKTFITKTALPYGGPPTIITMEYYCEGGETCSTVTVADGISEDSNKAVLSGVQLKIDSTGKANDLYKRVETRLDLNGASPYPLYTIQTLKNSMGDTNGNIVKNPDYTTCEYQSWGGFSPTC